MPTADPVVPDSKPAAAAAPPPFRGRELRWQLRRSAAILDVVLAPPARFIASVEAQQYLPRLAMLLIAVAVVGAIPYGVVLGLPSWWRIPVLYLGSTLICLPSLHVFGSYLGIRATVLQNLTLTLTIPAVAAVFTFGFAPILGFLRWTVAPDDAGVTTLRVLSAFLLTVALAAGIGQLGRCLAAARQLLPRRGYLLLAGWFAVFLAVVVRMGCVLGLTS